MWNSVTMVYGILYFIVFIYGACVGSFLNVCIYRIPLGLSVVKGRSFCPDCRQNLKGFDLVPIVSYLFLSGTCRFCKNKISIRYPIVEALCGLLYAAAFYSYGFTLKSVIISLFFSVLLAVAWIDWDTGLIPDSLVITILVLAPLHLIILPHSYSLSEYLIGAVIVSVPMLLAAYLTGGFGGGDIKLMAVCGLFMGARLVVFSAAAAVILAAAYGVILLVLKKADGKTQIPFGPFLSIGMILSLCAGSRVLSWYVSLMGYS